MPTCGKPDDYVSKMIELAGGKYIFQDLGTMRNAPFHHEHADGRLSMQEPRMRIISFTTVP